MKGPQSIIPDPDQIVDCTGKWCPIPIVDLAKAARASRPGALLLLIATDPAVERDVQAWCNATGNRLIGITLTRERISAYVEVGIQPLPDGFLSATGHSSPGEGK